MDEYKKIDDKKTELFLEPIPRWITSYGFVTMLILASAIFLFSYFFELPRTLSVSVHLDKQTIFTVLTFDQSIHIIDGSAIYIKTPFQKAPIIGKINKNGMWAEGNKVYIPVTIDQSILRDMAFKKELDCNGEILIDKASIFSKLFQNPIIE
jgi:hypothetical protein